MDRDERKAKEHVEKIGAAFHYECFEEKKPEGKQPFDKGTYEC